MRQGEMLRCDMLQQSWSPWGELGLCWPSEAVARQSKGVKRKSGLPLERGTALGANALWQRAVSGRGPSAANIPSSPRAVSWSSAGELWGSPQHPRRAALCSAGTHCSIQ